MAFDLTTATDAQILTELSKHTLERQRLIYLLAIEEITTNGQENWNGDKKHYEARLDHLQKGLEAIDVKLQRKQSANKCPFKSCEVNFV